MARTEGHKLLAKSGKTQAEIVRGTGRSAPTVYRWFNGGSPDIDSAFVLEGFLGIPVSAWQTKKNGKRKAS